MRVNWEREAGGFADACDKPWHWLLGGLASESGALCRLRFPGTDLGYIAVTHGQSTFFSPTRVAVAGSF